MTSSQPMARIQLPNVVRKGDLLEVRVFIQHPMETGFRMEGGKRVPRNAIHSLACRYNGVEVFRATMSPGIAANPYLKFYTRAIDSGDLELWWLDDNDQPGTARTPINVA